MGLILLGIYPYRPNSVIGWAILYIVSLPIVLLIEYVGMKVFEKSDERGLGWAGRIAYGVVAISAVMFALYTAFTTAKPYLVTWDG